MDEPRKKYSNQIGYSLKGMILKKEAFRRGVATDSIAPVAELDAMLGRRKFRELRSELFKDL